MNMACSLLSVIFMFLCGISALDFGVAFYLSTTLSTYPPLYTTFMAFSTTFRHFSSIITQKPSKIKPFSYIYKYFLQQKRRTVLPVRLAFTLFSFLILCHR